MDNDTNSEWYDMTIRERSLRNEVNKRFSGLRKTYENAKGIIQNHDNYKNKMESRLKHAEAFQKTASQKLVQAAVILERAKQAIRKRRNENERLIKERARLNIALATIREELEKEKLSHRSTEGRLNQTLRDLHTSQIISTKKQQEIFELQKDITFKRFSPSDK